MDCASAGGGGGGMSHLRDVAMATSVQGPFSVSCLYPTRKSSPHPHPRSKTIDNTAAEMI